jgi:predicted RNA-binding protein YlqC (UPF0109 family)
VTAIKLKTAMATDFAHLVLHCPSALVGRLIGKRGLTIKGVQIFTRAVVDVNQAVDPAVITIFGRTSAAQMAACMIGDIIGGVFKGFGNLREIALAHGSRPVSCASVTSEAFTYAPGIGLLPRQQLYTASGGGSGAAEGGAVGEESDRHTGSAWLSDGGGGGDGGALVAPSTMACASSSAICYNEDYCRQQLADIPAGGGHARVHVTFSLPQDTNGAIKVSGILQ